MISKYLVYLIISKLDFHWLMNSQPTQNIFTKGLLLAAAVFSIAATGVITASTILGQQYPSLAFAQQELGIPDTTGTDTTTTTTDNATEGTTTAADTTNATTTGGGNKLAGIIASLQLAPDRLELESDVPLFGAGSEGTEPTATSFNAIVEMTRLADGTDLHSHTFSDFQQSDVLHTAENTTTINGTMTASLQEGPVENVPVFITLQNNLISIGVDPGPTDNHFGPTPISGIILSPEHLQEISNRLAPTAAEAGGGGGGTETAGQQEDSGSAVTDTIGDATGQ